MRRGWWEADLDTIVGELDRYREQLAHAAQPPEVNSADPYLAGPIGYSRP